MYILNMCVQGKHSKSAMRNCCLEQSAFVVLKHNWGTLSHTNEERQTWDRELPCHESASSLSMDYDQSYAYALAPQPLDIVKHLGDWHLQE